MAEPFLAEVKIWPCNFAPKGYAFCTGQLLPISQNTALFSLVGTFYGGNGTSNFGLPNFQGNVPVMAGNGAGLTPRSLGEQGGVQNVTLLVQEIPSHTHPVNGDDTNGGGDAGPIGQVWGALGRGSPPAYSSASATATMSPSAIGNTGGTVPHDNMSPYLVVNFIIALQGIYPARN